MTLKALGLGYSQIWPSEGCWGRLGASAARAYGGRASGGETRSLPGLPYLPSGWGGRVLFGLSARGALQILC